MLGVPSPGRVVQEYEGREPMVFVVFVLDSHSQGVGGRAMRNVKSLSVSTCQAGQHPLQDLELEIHLRRLGGQAIYKVYGTPFPATCCLIRPYSRAEHQLLK